mmetsp:Transcript_12305/g.26603  ORF Transcript_12305/g.26603 Transcript_12305/m.26603 type:complete len:479 (-) Transcript_12305:737-2173(-)
MANNEPKETRGTAVPSSQYSDKLDSLLNFLDKHCEKENDSDDKLSSDCGRREADVTPTHCACTGLGDIANHNASERSSWHGSSERKEAITGQDEEELKDLNDRCNASSKARRSSAESHIIREKKYIWDDWSETGAGDIVLLQDEFRNPAGDGMEKSASFESSNGLPPNARQQLQELKSMSQEISARAASMKIELEQKREVLDHLHSIRVKSESDHVQKMKSAKQNWKKRLECLKTERDGVLDREEKLKEKLQTDCLLLDKTIAKLQADIERTVKSQREIDERLKLDGMHDLKKAWKGWKNAEREELKKSDQKMSPKLKRDAAKVVEPKLRQLMEKNKEEIARLERESKMELDRHKLELYRQSNSQFKKETGRIRAEERERMEIVEVEWIAKMENYRNAHEAGMKEVRKEHEQRAALMKRQFNADRQRGEDEHGILHIDAQKEEELTLQQIRVRYEREIAGMKEEYSEKSVQKKRSCEA